MRTPSVLCGVPIDDVTLSETRDRVAAMVEAGRRNGRTHQIVTVNVNFLIAGLRDAAVRRVLQRADLAVPDGMAVVWGAGLLGAALRERVAGADLVPAFGALCAEEGFSLYLFGGAPGIAEQAASLLRERHPALRVNGDSGPSIVSAEEMDQESLERIRRFAPDILCVALGHPKQEHWIDLHRETLGVPVQIGVGASLDFLTGTQQRAPTWMQRTGAEWVYRMLREPRRLVRRYARDLRLFLPRMLRELALVRSPRPVATGSSEMEQVGSTITVRSHGRLRLDATALGWSEAEWLNPPLGCHVIVHVPDRQKLDHRELAVLVGLARRLRAAGGQLMLASVAPRLEAALKVLHVDEILPVAHPSVGPASAESMAERSARNRTTDAAFSTATAPTRSEDRENHA